MCHRLRWFIHLRTHGLRKGDEHTAYTLHGVWHTLLLALLHTVLFLGPVPILHKKTGCSSLLLPLAAENPSYASECDG